jgi:hypothetical protein
MTDNDILLEQKIKELSPAPIDHGVLSSALRNIGYKRPNDKIEYMVKRGILKTLKRGVYIYVSPYDGNTPLKEIIANNLYGPSYVSFDYALYYYGLIPEPVYEVTSATVSRSKKFNTDFGVFSYRHTDKHLYPVGVVIIYKDKENFMIASKEKALCDKILSVKNLKITGKKAMLDFLEYDLRIDLDELKDFNINIIQKCIDITKSQKLKYLISSLKEYVY